MEGTIDVVIEADDSPRDIERLVNFNKSIYIPLLFNDVINEVGDEATIKYKISTRKLKLENGENIIRIYLNFENITLEVNSND
jgi:hypothetical protein